MARGTINVETVRILANTYLFNSPDKDVDKRLGTANLLKQVLNMTGNYNGFTYLESEYTNGYLVDRTLREGYDDSRRHYF